MMDAKHAMIGRAAASVFALLFACAAGGKLIDLPERGVENPPSIVASNIPEYKVDAHCRNVASFGGPSLKQLITPALKWSRAPTTR
jgi:hypothetical protein